MALSKKKASTAVTEDKQGNATKEHGGWGLAASVIAAIAAITGAGLSYQGVSLSTDIQEKGLIFQLTNADRDRDSRLLETALKILQDSNTASNEALRKWAIDVVDRISPVKFTKDVAHSLQSGELTLSDGQARPIGEPQVSPPAVPTQSKNLASQHEVSPAESRRDLSEEYSRKWDEVSKLQGELLRWESAASDNPQQQESALKVASVRNELAIQQEALARLRAELFNTGSDLSLNLRGAALEGPERQSRDVGSNAPNGPAPRASNVDGRRKQRLDQQR
ncbi:hypothetical protein [Tahibacter caeni]|uniref:hypothetical protein n=1 Tax=Tahibacter caeni TaxID=1453545 RepID=UPI002147A65D|nr:hypothetical protein [Tahibacter caeni]